ncbi:MAG: hypothetical protein ACE5DI_01915 [Candidatus Micrarchaeia archaeon]
MVREKRIEVQKPFDDLGKALGKTAKLRKVSGITVYHRISDPLEKATHSFDLQYEVSRKEISGLLKSVKKASGSRWVFSPKPIATRKKTSLRLL